MAEAVAGSQGLLAVLLTLKNKKWPCHDSKLEESSVLDSGTNKDLEHFKLLCLEYSKLYVLDYLHPVGTRICAPSSSSSTRHCEYVWGATS